MHVSATATTDVIRFSIALFVCLTGLFSRVDADELQVQPTSPEDIEFFEKHVRPLLLQYCYECHSADDVNGGLRLDFREGIIKGGDSGAAVVAGQPAESLLIKAVRYDDRNLQMPPDNRLTDAQIRVLEEWIRRGVPDPRDKPADVDKAGPTGMTVEEGRNFWSFRPVQRPSLPSVTDSAWVRSPIDTFILAGLESAGLKPAPPADRLTLLRRITFDLTGLPPTAREIQEFVSDPADDALGKVVDRLLSSPQYGVRWGRHWLDVARYADSNGLDENLAYGHAWRYRDYVIQAFNDDKPYDQFVVEQIAGDLLPYANRETKTATGFLTLGAKVLAEPDVEKLVMDTIDEQIDTTGKAFLGLTLGCCRCHDHKFDPVRQQDYYSLAAIFRSTRSFADSRTGVIKHWYEYSFASPDEKGRLKKIDAELARLKSAAASFKNKAIAAIRSAARNNAVEYLKAATRLTPETPFSEVEQLAEKRQLHPRILHYCRRHLEFNRDAPFFAPWHRLAAEGGEAAVEQWYGPLFVLARDSEAKARSSERYSAEDIAAATAALNDTSGFLAVPPKVEYAFDKETLAEYLRLEEEARVFESGAPDETAVMGVADADRIFTSLPIHIRGSHLNTGRPVEREFPEVLRLSATRPVFPEHQSGRLQLAHWIADTRNPLTARVFVNRVWGWHFGRPLVATTENFGSLGERPTHPELLDWLAWQFMQSGWSVKKLHRLILSSSTWQMASQHPDSARCRQVDQANRLLWKFRLQRLDAEQLRDAILSACDRLDLSIGGKSVPLRNRQFVFNHTSVDHTRYDSLRRATYLPVIRNNLYPLFEQFDFPDPTMPTGHRHVTTVAPQALFLMNSDLVMDSATQLAANVLSQTSDPAERVRLICRRVINREPTAEEVVQAVGFVEEISAAETGATGLTEDGRLIAWSIYCQSLFASNAFMYLR